MSQDAARAMLQLGEMQLALPPRDPSGRSDFPVRREPHDIADEGWVPRYREPLRYLAGALCLVLATVVGVVEVYVTGDCDHPEHVPFFGAFVAGGLVFAGVRLLLRGRFSGPLALLSGMMVAVLVFFVAISAGIFRCLEI